MSPELVERVARMLARAHFGVSGYWAKENAIALSFMADARYALELAERAAEEAVREYRLGSMANPVGPAVQRAVEGA